MPKTRELTITIEDKPGILGKCFLALADRGVNVLAFQSFVEEGESLARVLVSDMSAATEVLRKLGMIFEVTDAVCVPVPNQPGELGRAASMLGQAGINIDYSYCGLDAESGSGLLVFGIDQVSKAATVLDNMARGANR